MFVGCIQSSSVLKIGPDTYTVQIHAAPAAGGIAGATKHAIKEANEKCESLDKEILVANTTSGASTHLPGGTVKLTFYCLDNDDPRFKPPIYEQPSNNIGQASVQDFYSGNAIESVIDGTFEGFEGETIVKLINGQIWQQTEYYYYYWYAFMPEVLIYKDGSNYKMKVDGIDKSIRVMRLK